MTTSYRDTFILASPDSRATCGEIPPRPDTVAGRQYALLAADPYTLTSDDLLFTVDRQRHSAPETAEAMAEFFAKPRACLRASPLVRTYGWGIHHDASSRIAIFGVETPEYRALSQDGSLKIVTGMRSSKAGGKS